MDVSVRLDGANQSGQLRSLALWLTAERELRGRVRTVEPPPEEGTLGPVVQEVLIAVAQGGIGAFVAAFVGWIRQRGVDITCSVTTSTGITVEVSTSRVRAADPEELQALVADLAESLGRTHELRGQSDE
ncbi:effector-associated constant component EACC1 [Streptomyces phaeochromogenes]|uniref:effector-associated constant component EACC1 n=1 Tax=Streptomyces phaeochromogenes TaxID=1923 RepID=UPI0036871A7F